MECSLVPLPCRATTSGADGCVRAPAGDHRTVVRRHGRTVDRRVGRRVGVCQNATLGVSRCRTHPRGVICYRYRDLFVMSCAKRVRRPPAPLEKPHVAARRPAAPRARGVVGCARGGAARAGGVGARGLFPPVAAPLSTPSPRPAAVVPARAVTLAAALASAGPITFAADRAELVGPSAAAVARIAQPARRRPRAPGHGHRLRGRHPRPCRRGATAVGAAGRRSSSTRWWRPGCAGSGSPPWAAAPPTRSPHRR